MARVSAIVSTYNSERFLRDRLDNLFSQSLYTKGELEVIVINSGSKQGERYIIREYLDGVVYIESLREPIFAAWNRGVAISTGEYICNANTDDIYLRPDALEIMAKALDDNTNIGLVYGDAKVVNDKGEPSNKPPYLGEIIWPEFDAQLLTKAYYGGPNPMWRKALHNQYGYFDESYQLAGDYEFALRLVANGVYLKHISQMLTAFYDDGANINNQEYAGMEARRAQLKWRGQIMVERNQIVIFDNDKDVLNQARQDTHSIYGDTPLELTEEHIEALRKGKTLFYGDGEYAVLITWKQSDD